MRLVRNTVLIRLMDRFVLLTKSTLKRPIAPSKFPPREGRGEIGKERIEEGMAEGTIGEEGHLPSGSSPALLLCLPSRL